MGPNVYGCCSVIKRSRFPGCLARPLPMEPDRRDVPPFYLLFAGGLSDLPGRIGLPLNPGGKVNFFVVRSVRSVGESHTPPRERSFCPDDFSQKCRSELPRL